MKGFYDLVVKRLREAGWYTVPGGKGSHEKWKHKDCDYSLTVPFNCYSRHTANALMREANIDHRF